MICMQRLFERIAGISQEERNRWALAQAIYGAPPKDLLVLQTPACWRRKATVRTVALAH